MNNLSTGKFYNIRNYGTANMLNIYAGRTANGTNVCIWESDNSTEQKWRLEGCSDQGKQYLYSMVEPKKVLDFYSAQDNYGNADIWDGNDPKNQQLLIDEIVFGLYKIALSQNPDLILTAKGTENNSNVCWEKDQNISTQIWEFIEVNPKIKEGLDTAISCDDTTIEAIYHSPNQYDFIVRYYCAKQTSSKILTRDEAVRLSHFFNIVCVYQDANNQPNHFSYIIGHDDAKNALNYATSIIHQPENSAIYFAVDFNPDISIINQNIIPYFQGIQAVFNTMNAPYKIGVYGSGLVCKTIKEAGYADYTWLAQSTAYYGTADYNDPEKYSIRQGCHVMFNDNIFDSNASGFLPDFGQWRFK